MVSVPVHTSFKKLVPESQFQHNVSSKISLYDTLMDQCRLNPSG